MEEVANEFLDEVTGVMALQACPATCALCVQP